MGRYILDITDELRRQMTIAAHQCHISTTAQFVRTAIYEKIQRTLDPKHEPTTPPTALAPQKRPKKKLVLKRKQTNPDLDHYMILAASDHGVAQGLKKDYRLTRDQMKKALKAYNMVDPLNVETFAQATGLPTAAAGALLAELDEGGVKGNW